MNILFIADVFGNPGRQIVKRRVPQLREELKIDVCIANCENSAAGKGVTEKTADDLFNAGVDVLTSGNHLWDKKEVYDYLAIEKRITKPLNYPPKALGNPYFVKTLPSGKKMAIVTLIGQAFMSAAMSPFLVLDEMLPELKKEADFVFVDFHAEATAEKRAFGYYFDGRVQAVVGTHTHIQTADEEILPKGTAYITDAGMTGPHDSVIGIKKEIIFEKMITGMPCRYDVADGGKQFNGVFIEVDENTGKAVQIKRIKELIT
ncbi:MAG: TIGR00282 family metallophosphoesterase [Candidatus Cloacimonadia bacterium]